MTTTLNQTHALLPVAPDLLTAAARGFREGPTSFRLLCGHPAVGTIALATAGATHRPFAVIDGATRFNSYTLSALAPLLQIPPAELLRRAYVTRAFTAFQTEAALTVKLPAFLASNPCRIVVVMGLLDAYYDEQVKPAECIHSLGRIMQTVRSMTAGGIHVLAADSGVTNPPPGKERLFPALRQAADIVMSVQQHGGTLRLSEQPKVKPWDAITTRSR